MAPEQFSKWIKQVSTHALNLSHRKIVVLEGGEQWLSNLLDVVPSYSRESKNIDDNNWYVYSDDLHVNGNVNKQTFKNKLGTESSYVLFYVNSLNVDALAALSGTLVSGGILFIAIISETNKPSLFSQSLFNQRFKNKLLIDDSISYIKEHDKLVPAFSEQSDLLPNNKNDEKFSNQCITSEQFEAVKKIIQVVKGHRNRPLILTADRGRGKSSALAIACADLLINSHVYLKIVITSAHRHSLNIFFKQLADSLGDKKITKHNENSIEHENGIIEFVAIDELLLNKPTVGCLLVDEAASIPLYQLNELMLNYHRSVFSSTVHGYEGAGRSFSIKFIKQIKKSYPEFNSLHINQPIRWAENDPLERFIFDLCLLDAELPVLSLKHHDKILLTENNSLLNKHKLHDIDNSALTFNKLSANHLAQNEALLSKVFAVLVTAHYQTSPNDLKLLLDNENLEILTVSVNNVIAGVALLLREGGIKKEGGTPKDNNNVGVTTEEINLIKKNRRRLKNQFIPQSLLTHSGEENSFDYTYLRIMRIAIVPELQNKKIGERFLLYIESYSKKNGIDFIGTSFGANSTLLNFWLKQQYKIVRLGFTRDKASGEHSALLLKSLSSELSDAANVFLINIEKMFYASFDYLLSEQFKHLPAELVWQIMHYCPTNSLPVLSEFDHKAVCDFYTHKRQYSTCILSLHKWLQHQMLCRFDSSMLAIMTKVFQKHDVEYVCKVYNFTGKRSFNQYLTAFVEKQVNTANSN